MTGCVGMVAQTEIGAPGLRSELLNVLGSCCDVIEHHVGLCCEHNNYVVHWFTFPPAIVPLSIISIHSSGLITV